MRVPEEVRALKPKELLALMRENLEDIYIDDAELSLTAEEQHLLEKIETFVDLWHWLTTIECLHNLGPEEIYAFTLNLVVPNIEYDPSDSVSETYQKAIDTAESPYSNTIPTRPQLSWAHQFLSGCDIEPEDCVDIGDIDWGV